ncbi:MAG: hypothetical protein M1499_06265 [Firmicutes bacterium]|nr:hypothetical protein [Bacillota bacterium]
MTIAKIMANIDRNFLRCHQLRHAGGGILDAVWQALPPLSAAAQKVVTAERADFAFHHDASTTRAIG